ncbi:MAG: sigma factor-like helix-turn-helix DNA-binding protein [Thermomicrobiales bacterium]
MAAASVRGDTDGGDPEQEALLAEAVGLAMLVVLETLTPAERIAFVLHDLFAVPFADIAPIVQRSPAATRQLASRARRRVRGTDPTHAVARSQQRRLVDAFLAAARAGDFAALLAILDPDVVLRTYPAGRLDAPHDIRGAEAVATRTARGGAREAQPALIDGAVGVIVAPRGRMMMVLAFTIAHGKIARIEAIADPKRLGQLHLAVLGE